MDPQRTFRFSLQSDKEIPSPLVYVLITDALHEGLKHNPLGVKNAGGYRFLNDHQLRITSSGYADDMIIYAQSWKGIWEMHQWVREFCLAHQWNVNVDKCEYIISDCTGETDNRWLFSVDGRTPLRSKGPDTVFRYLGVWISMNLQWEKQRKVLNARIMAWRSTVIRNNMNSVKALTTVRDFLFPKLELGLQFADIDEKTCKNWTRIIIHTILEPSGISAGFARSINQDAFCSLANIPNLWRRTNTIRMTELLIALNTQHCDSGRSTRARVAAIAKPENTNWEVTLELLSAPKNLRRGVGQLNRHVSTLLYWRKHNVILIPNPQLPNPLLQKITSLTTRIISQQPTEIKIFTDGSTAARSTEPNSGIGVAVYNEKNKLIWQGGGVRTDGNNFVAEMAAAALALEASPGHIPLQLYMDSTSAMQAINKGSLSERRNIRSAARRWANLARTAVRRRQAEIQIVHVRSHQGTATFEEKGNDLVDKLANEERRKIEDTDPIEYFTEGDIGILLKHQENIVQQDPRVYLKKLELASMAESWKKTVRQSETLRKHPNTLIQMEKKVFRWACQENSGHMWIYFVLAALQWLPTKARKLKGQIGKDVKCGLCLQLQEDNISHMLVCPALEEAHVQIDQIFQQHLAAWDVLPEGTIWTDREVKTAKWARQADLFIKERFPHIPTPSLTVLKSLAEGAYDVEPQRGSAPFISEIEHVMSRVEEKDILEERRSGYGRIPQSLTAILQEKLGIQAEIFTDALHKSGLPIWYSQYGSDIWLGGKALPLEQNLEGLNILFNPPTSAWFRDGASITHKIIDKLCETKTSERPTRAVLVLPEMLKDRDTSLPDYARSKKLLEILRFPKGTFCFEDPENFSQNPPTAMIPFQGEVSLFLFINSRSLLFDPLDWPGFEQALSKWTHTNCPQGEIPQVTRKRFSERRKITGPLRRYGTKDGQVRVLTLMSNNHLKADATLLRKRIHNGALLKLVTKINKGDKGAATLGLFPHALKKLVCDKHQDGADRLEQLSRDVIRACADRFLQYQTLSALSDKFRRGNDKPNTYRCLDPFHFLEPITNQRMTLRSTCTCDLLRTKKKRKNRVSGSMKGAKKRPKKRQKKGRKKTPKVLEDTSGRPQAPDGQILKPEGN
jgi:ribonuclease HI